MHAKAHVSSELVQWASVLLTVPIKEQVYLADICSSVKALLFNGGHVCRTQLVIIVATDRLIMTL